MKPRTDDSIPGIRITPKVLKAFGCQEIIVGQLWEMRIHGYVFNIRKIAGTCTDGKPAYDFGGHDTSDGWQHNHSVTHVDEMIGCAYGDGLHDGKKEFKQELADLLGVQMKGC